MESQLKTKVTIKADGARTVMRLSNNGLFIDEAVY